MITIVVKNEEVYVLTQAALGEIWTYGAIFGMMDPTDTEGVSTLDNQIVDRILRAARSNDIRTLRCLSMSDL